MSHLPLHVMVRRVAATALFIFLLASCVPPTGPTTSPSQSGGCEDAGGEAMAEIDEAAQEVHDGQPEPAGAPSDSDTNVEEGTSDMTETNKNADVRRILFTMKDGDTCQINPPDWNASCEKMGEFLFPRLPALNCREDIPNGMRLTILMGEPSQMEEITILTVQKEDGDAPSPRRTTEENEEDDLLNGYIPVLVPDHDCEDPPCPDIPADYHYEIRGSIIFDRVIQFVTAQLVCLANDTTCPP